MYTLPNGVKCTAFEDHGEILMVLGEGGVRMGVPIGSPMEAAVRSNLPEIPFAPPADPVEIKTKEFLNRFTQAELASILTARKDNPELDLLVTTLMCSTHVDLDSPETHTGLNTLVTAGLIDTGRALEILAHP